MASNEPIWHREALAEAREARDWYARRSPTAALGFLQALDHAVEVVCEAPLRWPERTTGCRQVAFPNRYPFYLVYRFDGVLKIVAIAHQSRLPRYWSNR